MLLVRFVSTLIGTLEFRLFSSTDVDVVLFYTNQGLDRILSFQWTHHLNTRVRV